MKRKQKNSLFFVVATVLLVAGLIVGIGSFVYAAKPTANYQLIAFGVKTDSSGTSVTDIGWGRGNSDKGWREGDWIPVKCEISSIQSAYPNFGGFPNITLSWDFTMQNGARFVDLVRSVQIGCLI